MVPLAILLQVDFPIVTGPLVGQNELGRAKISQAKQNQAQFHHFALSQWSQVSNWAMNSTVFEF